MKKFFDENIIKYEAEEKQFSSKYNKISIARIASFIIALIAVVYFADQRVGNAISLVIILFLISFVLLIKWHNRIKFKRNHARYLGQINEDEINRQKGDLSAFDKGEEFISLEHPYSGDLDIFGRNSLFQLLNRTTTITGKRMLANWLLHPATSEVIIKRQDATSELNRMPDYCQNLHATGLHFQEKKASFEQLEDWLNDPIQLQNNKNLILASYLLPIVTLAMLAGVVWFDISIGLFLIPLLINGLVLKKTFSYSIKITEQTGKGVSTLGAISKLISQVEKTEFSSEQLVNIKNQLNTEGVHASTRINNLVRILDFFNARANMFYVMFNIVFLIDIHLIYSAEKWKVVNSNNVKRWFDCISETEVLASFASFSFANPAYANPKISKEPYDYNANQFGHPLIKNTERILNDFATKNKGKVNIITGSNMSGKSTFLRTLGINMVLAYAGAPVCAQKMELSIFQVFTSMRTQDNLEEHISSFYAELKRIEQLLALLKTSDLPVLFMLDEILKGTNSVDRHKGAMAIVKQLHNSEVMGFVSTHDLELGKQTENFQYCENYSFNSEIENNNIHFDYKISSGICRSFNASTLMKNIGIEMD